MASSYINIGQIFVQPIDEPMLGEQPLALAPDGATDGLALADQVGVIACGGAKQVAAYLYALGVWHKMRIPVLAIDNDHRLPEPVRLPDGRLVQIPQRAMVYLGEDYSRNQIADYPLLVDRYEGTAGRPGLLRGISVYESYPEAGHGGGGYPVISAMDIDLSIVELRRAIRTWLRTFALPRAAMVAEEQDFWGDLPPVPPDDGAPRRCTLLYLGGGCGSPGPAGHRLVPYIVRQELRDLSGIAGQALPEPYQVGVVTGPSLYEGFHDRAGANWLATVTELDDLTQHGLDWSFIDGSSVHEAAPPYARIILADGEREGPRATEEEVTRFHAQLAKTLFVALTSDVFPRTEAALNNRRHPWTTLRAVLAEADLQTAREQARTRLLRHRLKTLAPAGA